MNAKEKWTSSYLREFMMRHQFSQSELARRLDVKQCRISYWVNGKHNISKVYKEKLSRFEQTMEMELNNQ